MEFNASGAGGVFGINAGSSGERGASVGNSDTYAPEHGAIIPKVLGMYSRNGKVKTRKKKKK